MDKKPVDAAFKVVGHRFRVWPVILFLWGGGFYAVMAYQINNRWASAFLVFISALWWPLMRFLSTVREEVSKEQADWLAAKMTRRNELTNRKRLTYDPGESL